MRLTIYKRRKQERQNEKRNDIYGRTHEKDSALIIRIERSKLIIIIRSTTFTLKFLFWSE